MKQFKLLILLLVIGFVAEAQINYLPNRSRNIWIAGKFDSTFHVPRGATPSLRVGGWNNGGALFYNTSDSSLYVYTGYQWRKLGEGGSTDSTIFATVYRTDTLAQNIRNEILALPQTLQQVLATESNSAVITSSTDISPDVPYTRNLSFGDVGNWRTINFYVETFNVFASKGDNYSHIGMGGDSITIEPHLGQIYIDTLRTGTSTDSIMTYNPVTGKVGHINASAFGGGGSGVTTIGTLDGVAGSVDGAVISGSTLYMQTYTAENPGLVPAGFDYIDSVYRIAGKDSIFARYKEGVVLAIKDSVGVGGGGSGTVTSVGTGYGLSGGTITTTGTLLVDSASLSNYYLRRKDSLTASNLLGYVTRTVLADSAAAIRSAIGGSSGWALTGNNPTSGWTEGSFLGTTTNKSLLIRTNNILRARIDSAGAAGIFRLYPATRTDSYLDFGTTANTWTLFSPGINLTTSSGTSIISNSVNTAGFYNGDVAIGSIGVSGISKLIITGASTTKSAINLVSSTLKTTPIAGDIDRDHSYLYVTLGSATRQKIATDIDTLTLTNKRITPRVGTTASSSSLTIASDSYDRYTVTALAADMTINNPSGTPTDGQTLLIRIKDNGTARALTWSGSQFRVIGVTLPTTTVISKTVYIGLIWNSADSKWDVVSVNQEA